MKEKQRNQVRKTGSVQVLSDLPMSSSPPVVPSCVPPAPVQLQMVSPISPASSCKTAENLTETKDSSGLQSLMKDVPVAGSEFLKPADADQKLEMPEADKMEGLEQKSNEAHEMLAASAVSPVEEKLEPLRPVESQMQNTTNGWLY